MKNTLVRISLSTMTLLGLAAPGLLAADCFPSGNNGFLVQFSMVTLKNFSWGSQYASYVKGNMAISVTNTSSEKGITLSSGNQETQLFSDRIFAVPTWYGFANQPFSVNYPDTVKVLASNVKSTSYSQPINPDAAGSVTLVSSWGPTTFGVACNATTGELYGAASSDTFVVITFGPPQASGIGPVPN